MRHAVAAGLLLVFVSCASRPVRPVLAPIYAAYTDAIDAGDLAAAKRYVSAGRLGNLKQLSDDEALATLSVVSPKDDVAGVKEIFNSDDATLVVRAKVAGNVSTGRVSFAREDGVWKIYSEGWDIGTPPEASDMGAPPQPAAHPDAMRALKERGYAMPSADYLVMAAGTGDLEAVKLFAQAGYSVDAKANGTPAIVMAASSGHGDVVAYLLSAGAAVNAVDDVNTTALMRGAEHCEATAMIRALLDAGAKTDVRAAGGASALELAEYAHCDENAKMIREAASRP